MIRLTTLCAAGVALVTTSNATAIDLGLGLFKKKPPVVAVKPDPVADARQWITILQSDPDSNRRLAAADALKSIDPRVSPEVITSLIYALQRDPVPAVRSSAAQSIGSFKAIYPTAGTVLEYSEKYDPDANVRAAAKSALWQYHLNGYRSNGAATTNTAPTQTAEPPLVGAKINQPSSLNTRPAAPTNLATNTAQELPFRPISQGVGKNGNYYQPTNEPPLAAPPGSQTPAPQSIPAPVFLPPSNPDPVIQPIPSVPSNPANPVGGAPTITPPPVLR